MKRFSPATREEPETTPGASARQAAAPADGQAKRRLVVASMPTRSVRGVQAGRERSDQGGLDEA